jgi:hypothetical protein
MKPHAKEGGQLSSAPTKAADSTQDLKDESSRGPRTAENIRYGQGISEQGTAPSEIQTEARDEGVDAGRDERAEQVEQSRKEQGYYGSREMRRDVGA